MTTIARHQRVRLNKGRSVYVFIAEGCATGWSGCPNGEHAATVHREGGRPWMTECVDIRTLAPAEEEPCDTAVS